MAEQVRREIEATLFPGVGRLTASFGVADYEADAAPGLLVGRADEAMYRAKQSGRNRVVVASMASGVRAQ